MSKVIFGLNFYSFDPIAIHREECFLQEAFVADL